MGKFGKNSLFSLILLVAICGIAPQRLYSACCNGVITYSGGYWNYGCIPPQQDNDTGCVFAGCNELGGCPTTQAGCPMDCYQYYTICGPGDSCYSTTTTTTEDATTTTTTASGPGTTTTTTANVTTTTTVGPTTTTVPPTTTTAASSYSPIGNFDGGDCSKVSGWLCDGDDFNQTVAVHLYFNGPSGSANGIAWPSDSPREAAVGAQCGGNSNHGFVVPWTSWDPIMFDGNPRTFYAYGFNNGPTGGNTFLGQYTVTCYRPPNPTGLQAMCNFPSPGVVRISWNAQANVSRYAFYINDYINGWGGCSPALPGDLCAVPYALNYYDLTFDPTHTYDAGVRACGDAACSDSVISPQTTINFNCTPPATPTALQAQCNVPSTGQVTLDWSAVSNATRYVVHADDTNQAGGPCPPGAGEACTNPPIAPNSYVMNFNSGHAYNWLVIACKDTSCAVQSAPGYSTFNCSNCPVQCDYTETNQASINGYCTAIGATTCPANSYKNLACHARDSNDDGICEWGTYGTSCNAPNCGPCACNSAELPILAAAVCDSPTNGKVNLAWSAAATGPAPQNYQIEIDNQSNIWNGSCLSPNIDDHCYADSSSPLTVSGLNGFTYTPDVNYVWRVRACADAACTPALMSPAASGTFNCSSTPSGVCGTNICGTVKTGDPGVTPAPLQGLYVELRNSRGVLVKSVKTLADGSYSFASPGTGTFYVSVATDRKQNVSPSQAKVVAGQGADFSIRGVTHLVRVSGPAGAFVLLAPKSEYPTGYTATLPPKIDQNNSATAPKVYSAVIPQTGSVDIRVRRGGYFLTCWKSPTPSLNPGSYTQSGNPVGVNGTGAPILEPQTPGSTAATSVSCP
jgi:hypothetical protein